MDIEEGLQITAVCLPVTNRRLLWRFPAGLAEYDAQQTPSLLLFNNNDNARGPCDSSNGGGESDGEDGPHQQGHNHHSRNRTSIASNYNTHRPQSSPRMNVAQAFDNMTFHSPSWGTERLPLPRSPRAASPSLSHMPQQRQQQKPQSPGDSGPSNQFDPPTITLTEQQDEYSAEKQQSNIYDPAPAQSHASGQCRTGPNASAHSKGGVNNSPLLLP
ncbi:hypothetical protein DFH08DRAFT_1090140 [Mycena albidolilacea]|uniref:Uncharacterized protein n=1 Tax=Mycena albidolilacea TaxID=1033008 RepID=A0AAD7E7Z0_9AGAR|nr:hypothetical protein DFH08DRAFT_1090140 [Mycena albidolilacea]